jgi:hypothetical protein
VRNTTLILVALYEFLFVLFLSCRAISQVGAPAKFRTNWITTSTSVFSNFLKRRLVRSVIRLNPAKFRFRLDQSPYFAYSRSRWNWPLDCP